MLYQQVAEQLNRLIREGVLQQGQRVPSIRRLHREWGVSQSTALMALSLLEAQGVIESRPRSGFYVAAVTTSPITLLSTPEPSTVSRHQLILQVLSQHQAQNVMHLGAAVPEPGFLPVDTLRRLTNRCLREQPSLITDYAFAPGNQVLRQQIALRLQQRGCDIGAEQLLLTQGCQEAVSLALQTLLQRGDLVAIESPAYHGLLQALEALGLQALEIPCDPLLGMNVSALQEALSQWPVKACIVSANFSNPTGSLMPDEAKAKLVALMAEHQIPIIEDDTYADLVHSRRSVKPLKAWDKQGNVVYCSAVSKTFAPGFRIGWIAPGRHFDKVRQLLTVTTMAGHALSQQVIATFMQSSEYQRHLQRLRRRYRQQLQDLSQALAQWGSPRWRWSIATGGFLLWLALDERVDGLKLHHWLAQQGVSIMPGSLFSTTERFRHCIRISTAVEQPDWQALVMLLLRYEQEHQ